MNLYAFDLKEIDRTQLQIAGGKGANLGELSRIKGIHVPEGFCVSAEVFKNIIEEKPLIKQWLDQLSLLKVEDQSKISELGYKIRQAIEEMAIPEPVHAEVADLIYRFGKNDAYAVRSSATAEDLPSASFAGQLDTYLNIVGKEAVLHHILRCWASLFTYRAIIYRIQNGFDHRKIHVAVVVQKMIFPQVAGIMFTADPVTSNRKVLSIDASFGLGEALVSGIVNADNYKVRDGKVIEKKIPAKKMTVEVLNDGSTAVEEIAPEQQNLPTLTDEQVLQLESTGRKIEAHFGYPQDIEWCLADDVFYMVQSRPVTTLYPVPEAGDNENHIYVSVGHQQMMTDPMKPLGLSIWQLTAARPMFKAGGRLFVDVINQLIPPDSRQLLLNAMGGHDPLIKDALMTIIERGDFIKPSLNSKQEQWSGKTSKSPPGHHPQIDNDPEVVSGLIKRSEESVEILKNNIQAMSGPKLFDIILEDMQVMKQMLPESIGVIMVAINASAWINEKMNEWLGEKNVADTLSQSVPNNITSEMGLALLDVSDVIRLHPQVIEYLEQVRDDDFLDEMVKFRGGEECRKAISHFLKKYGMRCSGEIDITKPRWSEKPATLIPVILSHVKNFEPDTSHRKFEEGRQAALNKERDLLARLASLPDGQQKAEEAKEKIDLIRNFSGYREYPKYHIVNRLYLYKQALLKEAGRLREAGVIQEQEDIYYLTFEELHEAVRSNTLNEGIISLRKDEHQIYEKLNPPRVITSDGEIITGAYKRDHLPVGVMAGLPVSSGVVEGRARVILNMEDAALEEGDILVTPFTDPSWTPLFLSVKGLVTEVGGLMTHGAVIAREYGLPAVVGVENATRLISDGQRIRVNGVDGYVEVL